MHVQAQDAKVQRSSVQPDYLIMYQIARLQGNMVGKLVSIEFVDVEVYVTVRCRSLAQRWRSVQSRHAAVFRAPTNSFNVVYVYEVKDATSR